MAKQTTSVKKIIIEDDEHQEDTDELNPFSFKEFIRSKNLSSITSGDEEGKKHYLAQKKKYDSALVEDGICSSPKHGDPHLLDPFLIDSTPFKNSPHYDKKECSGSYEPSAIEEAHDFELCRILGNEYTNPPTVSTEELKRETILWQLDTEYLQEACVPKRSTASHDGDQKTSVSDISFQTEQCNTTNGSRDQQKLRQENAQLRNHIKELLKKSETDNQRIRDMMEELHKRRVKEEREAQALETMVHSVEQNLQQMTKRAVKAENSASKLKQELLQMQGQLEGYRSENERLRAVETTALNIMKHNAQVASEYLNKAANSAKTSIRQLLTEAETLCLVSQMLCSIDKISEIH
ncbi:hypothetical protein AAFF_G00024990 [Aldrovandia affinis]|uniref:Endosome-associated-trafficking regulator 1 n=1 Tax=Aldrovandia affinis TaxID=143900 RepID=A0AAD7T5Z7_9TELE|nr:hypothetical protein AAFF_G00024990 [Aldrovandia affinis]